MDIIKLTQYSHGSGCGCKIAPAVLDEILKKSDGYGAFPDLIVGHDNRDDAAVYNLGNGKALISTTDFFMPVVDDAFDFGRIAAANSISDVYAMGGKPLMAIAILGWPVDKLPASLAQQVIAGGRDMCQKAGIPLAGGHSIDSPEPIFGLAVNGMIAIDNLKKNSTAKAGDLLFLTKPVGIGIFNTAMKRNKASDEDIKEVIYWMSALNSFGEIAGKCNFVHAMTDITGFGLFGHLLEMAEGSNLAAEVFFDKIPLLKHIQHYLDQFIFPDMTTRNFNSYQEKITTLSAKQLFIGCDPQTNGGLLIAVDPESAGKFIRLCAEKGLGDIVTEPIGIMKKMDGKRIDVK